MVKRRSLLIGAGAWLLVAPKAWAMGSATLAIVAMEGTRGEDGSGRQRDTDAPHALLLSSPSGWPARALDPVLHIGDLHFHHYVHLDRTTLRFVVDDVRRLSVGDAVYVQYGDDTASRIRLADLEKSW